MNPQWFSRTALYHEIVQNNPVRYSQILCFKYSNEPKKNHKTIYMEFDKILLEYFSTFSQSIKMNCNLKNG